jgi:two-component system chemotaxis sensor kinase CheA
MLQAKDRIKALLSEPPDTEAAAGADDSLVHAIERFTGAEPLARPENAVVPGGGAKPNTGSEKTWNIEFRPGPDLLAHGGNPVALLRELSDLGASEITAHTEDIPELDQIRPDVCYLWWSIVLRAACDENAIRDVFIFSGDETRLHIELADTATSPHPAQTTATDGPPAPPATAPKNLAKESTVRVPSDRLDRLVNLVGEMVMNQSRLAQAALQNGAPEFTNPVQELERLVGQLRDDVLGIRMLPIGAVFGRFQRLVHDLSAELGKEVDLVTEGAETELDKSILDQLGEPLVHMLRNSIGHGIEPAEERIAQGKPRRGTIRLAAFYTGSDVVVNIEDDGRGINREAVLAKAVERRLVAADARLSDKEIFNLMLLPGFSTAREVTNISGRGVGMDVVKRQIDALRGSMTFSTQAGKGTKISLTLPLTLAIIEGLLVQVGSDRFVAPMSAILENVELDRAERERNNGRNVIALRGEAVPYIDLRDAFRIEGERLPIEKIVIVRHEDQCVGLVVDRVLGTHQTVIQSLGGFLRDIEVVSGATIMGDGGVALILDIAAVVRFAERQRENTKNF